MTDNDLYYCWACDAHRRVVPRSDGVGACPRCGQTLTADCRLSASKPSGSPQPLIPLSVLRPGATPGRLSA